MTGPFGRRARQRDVAIALALAASLEARQALPAAEGDGAVVHAGTRWEPRMVDERGQMFDLYARLLLVRMRGRVKRLQALADACRERAGTLTVLRTLSARLGRRPSPGGVMSLRPARIRHLRRVHHLAADLAVHACAIVIQAGAASDPVARTRMLAGARYQASRDVLDQMLGDPSLAGPPDRLIAELDHLDSHTPDQGTGQT